MSSKHMIKSSCSDYLLDPFSLAMYTKVTHMIVIYIPVARCAIQTKLMIYLCQYPFLTDWSIVLNLMI